MLLEEGVVLAVGFNFDVGGADYVIVPGGCFRRLFLCPFVLSRL
jgi:hypothetical protein